MEHAWCGTGSGECDRFVHVESPCLPLAIFIALFDLPQKLVAKWAALVSHLRSSFRPLLFLGIPFVVLILFVVRC